MIDIGCGSGIHSLAAIRANVAELYSFDYDPDSVAATRQLHAAAGKPAHWKIERGSVLDAAYMRSLGTYDLVYSWGVLHHTGDQWTAFRHAAGAVAPGGLFYVALYTSDIYPPGEPEFWLDVKRRYNRSGWFGRRKIEAWYIKRDLTGVWHSSSRITERVPSMIRRLFGEGQTRGMVYFINVRDWVGGWPMEFSSAQEVKDFAASLGLELVKIKTGEANNEYLFRRTN